MTEETSPMAPGHMDMTASTQGMSKKQSVLCQIVKTRLKTYCPILQ